MEQLIKAYFQGILGFEPKNKIMDKETITFFHNNRAYKLQRFTCENDLKKIIGEDFTFEPQRKDSLTYNIDGIDTHLSMMSFSQRKLVIKTCSKFKHIKSKLFDTNHTASEWISIINAYENSIKTDKKLAYTIQLHYLSKIEDDLIYQISAEHMQKQIEEYANRAIIG